ncbi:Epoxide hydrolase [Mycobacteroides abscessus subsp. abscessus]|nr:Epoxide hydrolase [Mycobacteroides abscessus subsp. abscessus]
MATDLGIRPFRIAISQSELDDLHLRLDRTRWPDAATGPDWSYGVPVTYLQDLARYWRHEYDWRACETVINSHPQFLDSHPWLAWVNRGVRQASRLP